MQWLFGELPEEVQQAIDRERAEVDMRAHRIQRVLAEMSEEQLLALCDLLNSCGAGGREAATYWSGAVGQTLLLRFGYCSVHRANHDEEAAQVLGAGDSVVPAPSADSPEESPQPSVDEAPPAPDNKEGD